MPALLLTVSEPGSDYYSLMRFEEQLGSDFPPTGSWPLSPFGLAGTPRVGVLVSVNAVEFIGNRIGVRETGVNGSVVSHTPAASSTSSIH
jgi:hypothetical protein